MKRITSVLALVLFHVASTAWPQGLGKRIINKDVIDRAGLGLSDELIIAKIRAD